MLSLNDQADVNLLVVRHPTVLQFMESLTTKLAVGHVVVVVNNPPILTGGTGVVFDLETVRDNAAKLFGVIPDIAPESEVTRHLALTMVHSSVLADYDWPGFIDIERFRPAAQDERRGEMPVLGRHSRDAVLKWPDKRSTTLVRVWRGRRARRAYPRRGDVTVEGAAGGAPRAPRRSSSSASRPPRSSCRTWTSGRTSTRTR